MIVIGCLSFPASHYLQINFFNSFLFGFDEEDMNHFAVTITSFRVLVGRPGVQEIHRLVGHYCHFVVHDTCILLSQKKKIKRINTDLIHSALAISDFKCKYDINLFRPPTE